MGGETTQYDVQLRYLYKEAGARNGVRGLSHDLDQAGLKSGNLKSSIMGLGAAVTTGLVGVAAKRAFIDFNSNLEQARTQMAGMFMQAGTGTWEESLTTSNKLIADFQQLAKQSVGTTKDFVDMASMIVRPITAAGLGMKDIEEFTQGAVIASRAFGIAADVAARDIEGALMGQLRSVDRFARSLLEPLGYVGEEGRSRFNQLSAAERAAELKKGLTSDAIKNMAKAQEFSFEGVTSTLKDNLQMTLGTIGLPLFKAITNEVKKWNEWIAKNPEKIKQFAADFTSALMTGFGYIKKIAGFIVEHKDLLLALAKAYIVGKGVGIVTGTIGGMANSLASLAGTGVGSFGALGLSISGVMLALAAWAGALTIIASETDAKQTRQIDAKGNWGVAIRGAGEYNAGDQFHAYKAGSREALVDQRNGGEAQLMLAKRMLDQANQQGFLLKGRDGRMLVNSGAIASTGADAGASTDEIMGYIHALQAAIGEEDRFLHAMSMPDRMAMFGTGAKQIQEAFALGSELWSKMTIRTWGGLSVDAGFSNKLGFMLARAVSFLPGGANDPLALAEAAKNGAKGKEHAAKVNVIIHKIEVQSEDADRFVFRLGEIARREVKNPSGSRSLREG